MKHMLVTGANAGIGLAVTNSFAAAGCFVFLGSRNVERGEAAKATLEASLQERVQVLQLDVVDAASVAAAAAAVKAKVGDAGLDGLVNNAGGGAGMGAVKHEDFLYTMQLNWEGTRRVTDAFLPLVAKGGRVVMTSSGAAPMFVEKCSAARKAFFVDEKVTVPQIEEFAAEATSISASEDNAAAFGPAGLGDGAAYGMSKAIMNSYTIALARENPHLLINACSPGFVETNLTMPFFKDQGKTPKDMGAISPEESAKVFDYLMLSEACTSTGWYYGSDAKRSPMHKYRKPGDAEFDGVLGEL
eukprot:CAMPEP_0180134640 /NCGR_PEP_ID=MMETSP0986-20121125/10287_1 /TAXON_ID=697907 /ORGANISM="non described non described, Strain CCMP2293" /LENGTH=300 /DNA_ID=CAMNT_0022075049 /DNA_START=45 /DNA_END=947 /DNA_ORIENTATION=+